MPNKYDIGDLVIVRGQFTDPANDGAFFDPQTVKCDVRNPSGVVTTYTYGVGSFVEKEAVGKYKLAVNVSTNGAWHFRWYAEGTGQTAEEGYFYGKNTRAVGTTTTSTTTTAAP